MLFFMKKLLGIGKKVKFRKKQFLLMNFIQKHLLKMKMVAPQLHCLKDSPRSVPLSLSTESPTQAYLNHHLLQEKWGVYYERCRFCIVEPQSFEEAIKDEDWKKAMENEIDVIDKKQTWQLVEMPKTKKSLGWSGFLGVKYHFDGRV